MSLEQALKDNTLALVALTAALAAAGLQTAVAPAPAPAPAEAPKTTVTLTPQQKAEQAAAEGKFGPVNEGDAAGTMYFANKKNKSVYRIFPGDPHVTIAEAKQISGADFLKAQEALKAAAAATTATAQPPVSSPATPDTDAGVDIFGNAAAPAVDRPTMVAMLMEVAKVKGQPALVPVLQAAGAKNVPGIADDKIQSVYDAAKALLA